VIQRQLSKRRRNIGKNGYDTWQRPHTKFTKAPKARAELAFRGSRSLDEPAPLSFKVRELTGSDRHSALGVRSTLVVAVV